MGDVVAVLPFHEGLVVAGLYRSRASDRSGPDLIQVRLHEGGEVFRTTVPEGRAPGPQPLRPLSADEARGLPPEEQLQLRDSAGGVVEVDGLMIRRESVPEEGGPFPDFCRAHGFRDVVDVLTGWRHPEPRVGGTGP